ncbi:MAG: glycosyltransferase family 4 protein [Tepidibacillus sp.]
MNILVIAPEQLPIPPIEGGSVESATHQIFSRMAEKDDITLISRAHPKLPAISYSKNRNYKIVRIPLKKPTQYLVAGLEKVKRQSFDLIQIENRPNFVPIVRNYFSKTPIVLSLHSLTFMSQLTDKQANKILNQVNGVTSVVSFLTKTMQKRFPKHANKFFTSTLGVDPSHFMPKPIYYKKWVRMKWGGSRSYNILFVGRIVPKKGLHTLVRAVAMVRERNPQVAIIAVGSSWPGAKKETAYMKQVRVLAKKRKVPIVFTGYIPPSQMNEMYHLGDVFVCPTQYREGFATVNSEAMASGIPLIASDRGGIREVVQHMKTGWLVKDYKNPKAFAYAIEQIMTSSELANRFSYNGRKQAIDYFSWYSTVKTLRKHYLFLSRKNKSKTI